MLAILLAVLVAAIHLYFLYLEMFRWEAPRTRKAFGTTPELANATRTMAANQGLYNGFLATGILFALYLGSGGTAMLAFLLLCVVVAGVYARMTGIKPALVVQSVPAALALLALWTGL